jgi:hypothetical protein
MGECCSTHFTHRASAEIVEFGKSVRYCLQSVGVGIVGITEHATYSFHWIVDEITETKSKIEFEFQNMVT